MELTSEQLTKLKDAQARNVIKKLLDGKVITRAEQSLLDSAQRPEVRIFENLDQAAAALGTTRDALRKAKRLGCPAFLPGSRIDGGALKTWLADPANISKLSEVDDKPSLELRKLHEQIRAIKHRNDVTEGRYVLKVDCVSAISKCLGAVDAILEQKLCDEYPSTVFGLPIPEIRVFGKRISDAVRIEFQKLAEHWRIE